MSKDVTYMLDLVYSVTCVMVLKSVCRVCNEMFRIRFKFTYTSYTVIFLFIAVNDNTSERHIIDLKNIRNGFQS